MAGIRKFLYAGFIFFALLFFAQHSVDSVHADACDDAGNSCDTSVGETCGPNGECISAKDPAPTPAPADNSCTSDSECDNNSYCDKTDKECIQGCKTSPDSCGSKESCNASTHECEDISCTSSSQCSNGSYCDLEDGQCTLGCAKSSDCSDPTTQACNVNHDCTIISTGAVVPNKYGGTASSVSGGSSGAKSQIGQAPTSDTGASKSGGNSNGDSSGGSCPDTVNYDRINGLCVPKSQFKDGFAGQTTVSSFILYTLKILLTFAGIIAVGAMVIGGFFYITAAGNEEQTEKGRKVLTNAIIGLVVVILSYTIVNILTNFITSGKY